MFTVYLQETETKKKPDATKHPDQIQNPIPLLPKGKRDSLAAGHGNRSPLAQ